MKDFLPVGSVVRLEDGKELIAIVGFAQAEPGDDTPVYDYAGVPYPLGYLGPDDMLLFNSSDIEETLFTGFLNEKGKIFAGKIGEITQQVRDGEVPRS